jgi:phosphoserine phosphatase RsbU/P
MRPWKSLSRAALLIAAVLFFASATLYSGLWMYDNRHPRHAVELGFNLNRDTAFDPQTSSIPVYNVATASPAESAGLRAGDGIIGINGEKLTSYKLFDQTWSNAHPGQSVEVTVRRPGEADPLTLHGVFRARRPDQPTEGLAAASAKEILRFYPVLFLVVGFAVLFLRVEDPYAWLMAVFFTCFIAVPNLGDLRSYTPVIAGFLAAFRAIFNGMIPAVIYVFFAVFPERSPIDRRVPWLKWLALGLGFVRVLPGWTSGDAQWPALVFKILGDQRAHYLWLIWDYGFIGLGIVSLVWNSFGKRVSKESRKKSRVIVWGTIFGVLPVVIEHLAIDFAGYRPYFWLDATLGICVLLYPLSFAYAVVKHRVLEIPALLRRSARYVLVQRSFSILILLGAILAIYLFTDFFSSWFTGNSRMGMGLSALFGVALVWASGPLVKRGTLSIDRAFFRSSYDARLILQDLVEKTRGVTNREELAKLLDGHLAQALHPKTLAFYFDAGDGTLAATGSEVPAELLTLKTDLPFLKELTARGRTLEVAPGEVPGASENFPLAPLAPECVVPMLGYEGRLTGVLVLGPALSEEPYSSEDKRLLDSVAGPAAVALENIRMAETIADRMEIERRAAHELQIAREVQSRLFPQALPPLSTLEYAGSCIQAREVGGDYYDFLAIGDTHLVFVLADISGKGIAGALLMANLQANLRSRYALALEDLPRLLQSVNQLFYENTPDDRYATLFLAVYNDRTRRLQYANCGHNPPLLLRTSGAVERLSATSTVIGLFEDWKCETQDIHLERGDLLVVYTDGVTEANDASESEFGEARLLETVRAHQKVSAKEVIAGIQQAVQKFSPDNQSDDLTLVVAHCR